MSHFILTMFKRWYLYNKIKTRKYSAPALYIFSVVDKGNLWQRMQNLWPSIHCVPMVSRSQDALQENRDLSDMLQVEKCLPDLSFGLGIW